MISALQLTFVASARIPATRRTVPQRCGAIALLSPSCLRRQASIQAEEGNGRLRADRSCPMEACVDPGPEAGMTAWRGQRPTIEAVRDAHADAPAAAQSPTAYCLLPTAYCLLPTAYCLLPTAYCLLPPLNSLSPPRAPRCTRLSGTARSSCRRRWPWSRWGSRRPCRRRRDRRCGCRRDAAPLLKGSCADHPS